MAGWPDALKAALQSVDAAKTVVEMPGPEIEAALKKGRIALPWKTLRSRLAPAVAADTAKDLDDTEIELPLPAVVPLFMAKHKPAAARKQTVAVADSIPDFFKQKAGAPAAPAPAPAAAPAAEAAPAPTPAVPQIPLPPPPPMPKMAAPKKPATIGEIFGQPDKSDWDLNQVVQKTVEIPGISGAVIAMEDGLLVAGQLGAGLDSEAVAGFLPQTFSKLVPFVKVLNFAEPNALTFIVDETPLQVRKAGTLYFAVLGHRGQTLPNAELAVIAEFLAKQSM